MNQIAQRIANNLAAEEIPWDDEDPQWETDKNCILDNTGVITDSLCGINKTNPNSIYIKGYFYFKGYKKYSLDMYIDTGASMCTANKHVIPEEFWVQAKEPIRARTANDDIMVMDKVAEHLVFFRKMFMVFSIIENFCGQYLSLRNSFNFNFHIFVMHNILKVISNYIFGFHCSAVLHF